MNAEIIVVSADFMSAAHSGSITSYISKKLFELGHRTLFETVSSPSGEEVRRYISQALNRSDLIIVLGGIEPQLNAVAKNATALITGIPLTSSNDAMESVKNYCDSIEVEATPEHFAAAITLEGAEIFKNDLGLCCGMAVEVNSKKILLLPDAEGELKHMFENYIAPTLSTVGFNVTHSVNTVGLSASEIEERLKSLSNRSEYALIVEKHGVGFDVRISAVGTTRKEAEAVCSRAITDVTNLLGKSVFAVDSEGIQFEVVSALRDKALTVATAESCTAGMLSEMLTEVGGSSKVFEYGISAYSNRIKTEALKIPKSVIDTYSAISRETAMYMAKNIREISGSSLGIGITGNAGPEPSEQKPVGMAFVALADENNYIVKDILLPPSLSRDEIRSYACAIALDLIRKYAASYPDILPGMIKYNDNAPLPHPKQSQVAERVIIEKDADENLSKDISETSSDNIPDISELSYNVSLSSDEFSMIYERDTDNGYSMFERDTDDDDLEFDSSAELQSAEESGFILSAKEFFAKIIGVIKKIIPSPSDNVKRIIIKSAFFVSLISLIVSATVIFTQLTGDSKQREILDDAREMWSFDGEKNEDETFTAFEPFIQENEDIRGWITIPGTLVDNPIYQTTDNDYYLTHNMYKEKSRYGALFFDYRCSVSKESPTQNVTIYGHEMKDGSMFGTLKKYKNLNFYKENPTFTVTKLKEQSTYKIFSIMIMNATAADDNGYLYNYTTPSFETQEVFLSWIDEAYERSLIKTEVSVQANDQIITLVTCINDFPDARLVIMARMTRPDENTHVNTSYATLNPNPRYPQAWYDKKGLDGYSKTESTDSSKDPGSSDSATSSDKTSSVWNPLEDILSKPSLPSSSSQNSSSVETSSSGETLPPSDAPPPVDTPSSSETEPSSDIPSSSDTPSSSETISSSEPSTSSETVSSGGTESSEETLSSGDNATSDITA